jgi:DivIVA domain-containing protein
VIWVLLTAVAVLVIGGLAALVTGRIGYDPLSEPTTTHSATLVDEDFHAEELAAVRFDTALRGYRMDQVDALLDTVQARIAELEATIASEASPTPRHDALADGDGGAGPIR